MINMINWLKKKTPDKLLDYDMIQTPKTMTKY